MKKIIIIFLIITASVSFAQTKYLIYFKDKAAPATEALSKTSALFKLAEKELSPKAVERRKQVMGEDNYITFEDIPLNENYLRDVEKLGIKIQNKLKWFNAVSAYLNNEQLSQLNKISFIEKVERVQIYRSRIRINDTVDRVDKGVQPISKISLTASLDYGPSLSQNELSDIPVIHELGIKGKGVYIGILDNGFNYKINNSLKNLSVKREYDYVQNDSDVSNYNGHGTAVFSLMAGYDPGNLIGPAFESDFFLARTENDASETKVEEDNYARALEEMESAGVNITSSSLGYNIFDNSADSYTFTDMDGNTTISAKALNIAYNFGVSTFTAAGNERGKSWNHIITPADAFNVITVGAVNYDKSLAFYSSPGPTADGRIKPEVVAWGTSPYHAQGSGYSNSGYGTSYATPIAAGIAALLKSAWPHLTNVQIRKIFLESGDNTTAPNNDKGYGLISAKRAVSYPNLSKSNGVYNVINKIFINPNGVLPSTVSLNYKIGNSPFQTASMIYDGILKYSFTLPSSTVGDSVKFFFTYMDGTTQLVREPVAGSFRCSYGYTDVSNLTSVESYDEIPSQISLQQNYPNPFNPSTVIAYQLSTPGHVSLKVYDLLGREAAVLVDEYKPAGSYNTQFSTLNLPAGKQGYKLSSGVYFYTLRVNDFVSTKKMMLLK